MKEGYVKRFLQTNVLEFVLIQRRCNGALNNFKTVWSFISPAVNGENTRGQKQMTHKKHHNGQRLSAKLLFLNWTSTQNVTISASLLVIFFFFFFSVQLLSYF